MPRKPTIPGEGVPKNALGVGWIAAKEPRQPAYRASARPARHASPCSASSARSVFGLLAVEHAAARRPLAAFAQRHHDAVQRLDVLLGGLHAGEDVAQIDQHGGALVERTEIFDGIELAFEIGEERLTCCLPAGSDLRGMAKGSAPPDASLNHS